MSRIKAVIFDWAGTVVDYGSRAPVNAFLELFARHGVTATVEQARAPMGAHKREHIREMLAMPAISAAWQAKHHRAPSDADLDHLYKEFIPLQTEVIARHADVLPQVPQIMAELRRRGIQVGSTTGYTREMTTTLVAAAARGGFAPDSIVCADEVPAGRPAPWMALEAARRMNTWPVRACVKIGDTLADIAEGRNAGMWSVGITRTGNELGLSQAEADALPPAELARRLEDADWRFRRAGAHDVIEDLSRLPALLDALEASLARGQTP